jgi:hypothetical protein
MMRDPSGEGRMVDLIDLAERLRSTRAACRKFLALWQLQEDRKNTAKASNNQESELADPMNHDWSLLYMGSILDD